MDQNTKPPQSINWKKISIWVVTIIVFLILLLIIGGFILQNKLPEQLKNRINQETKGIYQLNFDEMDVSLFAGSVNMKNIHFVPDTGAYFKSIDTLRSANLFEIQASSLNISGISFLKLILNRDLQISAITLNQPKLIVIKMHDTAKVDLSGKKTLYQLMPEFLKDAKLKLLRVNELSYVTQERGDTTKRGGKWSGLSFVLESIFIDSLSYQDSSAFWFCKDIKIDSKNLQFSSADKMYKFRIGEFKTSLKEGFLNISDFKVIPQYPEIEFTQRMEEPGDRYNFVFSKIDVQEIDFKKLEQIGQLRVSKINLENTELRIFNNKNLQGKKVDKTHNFPHLALKKLNIPLNIDTLFIKNVAIYYKELNPESDRSGTVFFTNLYGTIHNITNDSVQLNKNAWSRSKFQMNFLGKVKLLVDLNLNLVDKNGEFNYKGSLGQANGKFYNQVLEPMALAKIEDGVIRKVSFSVNANRYGSTAQVQMLYDDLKVNLLKQDGKVLKKKGLLSFLANTFVVKNSNPRNKDEAPIIANVSHIHEQDRSFFNLMWKSIFTGLKVNVGLPEAKK